jgi:hypothetical protein
MIWEVGGCPLAGAKVLAGYEASPHAESRLHVSSANTNKYLTSNLSLLTSR